MRPLPAAALDESIDDLPALAAAAARVAFLIDALDLLAGTYEAATAARLAAFASAESRLLGPASPVPLRDVLCFGIAFVARRQRDEQRDWGVLGC